VKISLNNFEKQLHNGGDLIISGILTSDIEELVKESKKTGLEFVSSASLNMWARLRFKKK
jgi:ribosomal protein L11 methylase PrmA